MGLAERLRQLMLISGLSVVAWACGDLDTNIERVEEADETPEADNSSAQRRAEADAWRSAMGAPIPAGETVRVGDWDITVLSATPDATDALLAASPDNKPPVESRQFYLVELAVTYQGGESESLLRNLGLSAVGESAVAYDLYRSDDITDIYCGSVPEELDRFVEVFPGGSLRGNQCWQVRAEDVDSLVLIVDSLSGSNEERAYMALPPVGVVFEPPPTPLLAIEDGDVGTRGNPTPAGETVRVGDWDITVLSTTPDATEAALAESQSNDPPAEGHQFYMAEVAATYQGRWSEQLAAGLGLLAVGDSSVAYDITNHYCGVVPGGDKPYVEVFPGGSLRLNLCWEIRSEDAHSLVFMVDDPSPFDRERMFRERLFMALPRVGLTFEPPLARPIAIDDGDVGTRGNPTPAGETVAVGDWDVTVLSATPDATDAVLAESQSNDPPAEGHQFYMAEVAVTYRGIYDDLWAGVRFKLVGDSSIAYYSGGCGETPDEFEHFVVVSTGESQRGHLCWEVRSEDADSLVLIADGSLSNFAFDRREFMALPG